MIVLNHGLLQPALIAYYRYDRAMENPIEKGVIKYFSRGKGHGFISRENASEDIFVHVSE